MVDRFQDDRGAPAAACDRPFRRHRDSRRLLRRQDQGYHQESRLHRWPRCTAIWLSPVFENNPALSRLRHQQLPDIDPHFGTKQDLVELVDAAHSFTKNGQPFPIRVILDVVINHSGDNWFYPGGNPFIYFQRPAFRFGASGAATDPSRPSFVTRLLPPPRRDDATSTTTPIRRTQHGDIVGLKDYANDDDAIGSDVINTLIKAHATGFARPTSTASAWTREAHGRARLLAVLLEHPRIRLLAGQAGLLPVRGGRDARRRSLQPLHRPEHVARTATTRSSSGSTRVLDFRLAEGVFGDPNNAPLRDVLKGSSRTADAVQPPRGPAESGAEPRRDRALPGHVRGQPRLLLAAERPLRARRQRRPGHRRHRVSCSARSVRPASTTAPSRASRARAATTRCGRRMFDKAPGARACSIPDCPIYQEIAKIAAVMRTTEPLRFGRMYYRQISGDGVHFGFPFGSTTRSHSPGCCTGRKCWSPTTCPTLARQDGVVVDATLHPAAVDDDFPLRRLRRRCRSSRRPTARDSSKSIWLHVNSPC